MGSTLQVSAETRRAQSAYANAVRNHPHDEARVDAARCVWAEHLAADLRRRADALEAEHARA